MSAIDAYNILVVAPTPNVGQWLYMESFIRELIIRGHKVTGISSYNARRKQETHKEIIVPALNRQKICKKMEKFAKFRVKSFCLDPSKNVYQGSFTSEIENLLMDGKLGLMNAEHVFRYPKVQELINDKEKTFDLVIVHHFYQESFYLFAKKYNCPLVTIGRIFLFALKHAMLMKISFQLRTIILTRWIMQWDFLVLCHTSSILFFPTIKK